MKKQPKLHVVVAPKQKKVKIMLGKKVLKEYSFKMDVPSRKVLKEVAGYDHGAWSVSDRDFTYTQEVTEWDQKTIEMIKEKTLAHYNKQCSNKL